MLELSPCPRFKTVINEFFQGRHWLFLADSHFALCERGPVRCLHLPRHPRIALFGALLDVSAVEQKVIPINATAFEDCHLPTSFYCASCFSASPRSDSAAA